MKTQFTRSLVTLALLLVAVIAAGEEPKTPKIVNGNQLNDAAIYDWRQVEDGSFAYHLEFSVMPFEYEGDKNQKVDVYVLPMNLKIEARADLRDATTLNALLNVMRLESHMARSSASEATLLVPEKDLDSWRRYHQKLRERFTITGTISSVAERFEYNEHFLVIHVLDSVKDGKKFRIVSHKIRAAAADVTIVSEESPENFSARARVDWGLCFMRGDGSEAYIQAPQVTILVSGDEDGAKWKKVFDNAKLKLQPHRIPPPETNEK